MTSKLITDLLEVLDQHAGGTHAGFRPVHAWGVMCSGTFTPSPEGGEADPGPSRQPAVHPGYRAVLADVGGPDRRGQ